MTRKKRRRNKNRFFEIFSVGRVIFFLLIIFAGAAYLFLPRYIKINSIFCKSQYGPCGERIDGKVLQSKGKSLFGARKNIKNDLNKETAISDFSIQYKLPDKLEVNIITRKPFFGLSYEQGETVALVDKEGYVLSFQDMTPLPFIKDEKHPPPVGEKVDEERLFALQLILDVYGSYQTQQGKIENDSLTVELKTGERVIFPLEGDRQVLAASLSVILAKLNRQEDGTKINNSDGEVFENCTSGCTIDLRYKNPVVRN